MVLGEACSGPAGERTRECRRILDYWHKIEFFLPFNLLEVTEVGGTDQWKVRHLAEQELGSIGPDLWEVSGLPADRQVTGFDLYLGVFDKSELAHATQDVVGAALGEHARVTPAEKHEQDERAELDLEGPTCYARVRVDTQGGAHFEGVSISTAPWAVGAIQRSGWSALGWREFQEARDSLVERLADFCAERARPGAAAPALTGKDLLELLKVFEDWAGFQARPAGAPWRSGAP